jgi:hypothetical protein
MALKHFFTKAGGWPRRQAARRNLSAFLAYVLVIALLYLPVVVLGRTLQAPLYVAHGVTENGPYGYDGRTPVNTFSVDLATPAYYEWPVNALVGEMYRQGEIPLWNPYQGLGTPLAAQYNTRAFFPYQILEDLSPRWSWDFFMLGRLLLAGFLVYLFLRRLKLDWVPSFAGGLFYMFSGTFIWFINLEEMTNVAMTAPLLVYSVDSLWHWRWQIGVPALAGSIGLVLLGGQPEVALYVLLLGGAYAIFMLFSAQPGGRRWKVLGMAAAVVLGFGLAMPQVLPFVELASNSHNIHPPGGEMGTTGVAHPLLASLILIPGLNNMPTWIRELPENGAWDYVGGFTGVLAACLIVLGIILFAAGYFRRYRGLFYFFLVFGVVVLLKNFGVPPFIWLGKLPLFDQAWSPRWGSPAWTLPLAITAALALQAIMSLPETDKKHSRLLSWLAIFGWKDLALNVVIIGGLGAIALGLLHVYRGLLNAEQARYFFAAAVAGVVAGFLVLIFTLLWVANYRRHRKGAAALLILALAEFWFVIPTGYDETYAVLRLIPFGITLLAMLALMMDKRAWTLAGIVGCVAVITGLDLLSPKGMPQRCDPAAPPPYAGAIRELAGPDRITGLDGILWPDYAGVLGVQDVRYINALTPKWFHEFRSLYLHRETPHPETSGSLWFTGGQTAVMGSNGKAERVPGDYWKDIQAKLPFYSLSGVRYVVAPEADNTRLQLYLGRTTEETRLKLRPDDFKEIVTYENTGAFPRAWVARQCEYASSSHDALMRIGQLSFDLRNTVVLENYAGYFPVPPASHPDHISITSYRPDQVLIEADLGAGGILVLSDLYYPGWSVSVDGKPKEILRVDGFLRGVSLEAGVHTVTYSYFPLTFRLGLIFAGASLLVSVVLLVSTFIAGGRKRPR